MYCGGSAPRILSFGTRWRCVPHRSSMRCTRHTASLQKKLLWKMDHLY